MNRNNSSYHSLGYGLFILVWLSLIVLTGLTVVVAGLDLKALTVTAALLVASTKTILVLSYFMHLKFEPLLFRYMVIGVVVTLAIFILLTFFDVLFR
jgi:cytochrome c oxidase subunit 4